MGHHLLRVMCSQEVPSTRQALVALCSGPSSEYAIVVVTCGIQLYKFLHASPILASLSHRLNCRSGYFYVVRILNRLNPFTKVN